MIYTGDNEILGIKLGNTDINAIYAGDLLLYPTTVTGWSVNPSSFEVKGQPGSVSIRITSLSAWTISTSESWITFSQNSGDSGRTTVVATYTENTGDSARTATITVTDGTNTTNVSLEQLANAVLPSKTFICNYNAKEFDTTNRLLPKTVGQVYDSNLTFGANYGVTPHIEDGYISIPHYFNGGISLHFSNPSDNPFNRYNTESGRTLTIVLKSSTFNQSILGNRGQGDTAADTYNYMVRNDMFHTSQTGFLAFSPTSSPYILYIRVNADGTCERKCVTTGQIATSSTISFGNQTQGCQFFGGGTSIQEPYVGDFYWIYFSTEVLTDAEIQQVIDYNEGL